MSGKGSKPRPLSIPRKQFDDNWERIFGKKQGKRKESDVKSKSILSALRGVE